MIHIRKTKTIIRLSGENQLPFTMFEIKAEKFLDEYYKYVAKYSGKSSSFNQFEVERKIKPLFNVLKQLKSLEYKSKNENYNYSADLQFIMND